MPFKETNRNGYKTVVRWNGVELRAGCGTTDRNTAVAIEEMVRKLKVNGQDDVLDAIIKRQLKLGRAYVLYTQEKLRGWKPEKESPDLVPMIEDWKTGIANMNKGETPRTILEYERDIRVMFGKRYLASAFTPKAISAHLASLKISGSSRNRAHSALSVFADYLVEREVLTAGNPLRSVARFPENPPREIWLDNHDDAKKLVMALPMPYRAVVALMLATGMESQAVWRLRRSGCRFGAKPTVHANGDKNEWRNRVIPPTDLFMWKIFEEYARNFLPDVMLFGDVLSDTTRANLTAALETTGIDKLDHAPQNLHDLRHVYAVFALRDGLPLYLVARQLGHKDTTLAQKVYGRFVPNMSDYDVYLSRSALANPIAEGEVTAAAG